MFCRKCGCCNYNENSNSVMYDENDLETKCNNISNSNLESNDCECGFYENNNGLPENPVYAQSYVPLQIMSKVFKPEVGLKKGTIFPELVSTYYPNQSIEEIEYIKASNKIGKGCNG